MWYINGNAVVLNRRNTHINLGNRGESNCRVLSADIDSTIGGQSTSSLLIRFLFQLQDGEPVQSTILPYLNGKVEYRLPALLMTEAGEGSVQIMAYDADDNLVWLSDGATPTLVKESIHGAAAEPDSLATWQAELEEATAAAVSATNDANDAAEYANTVAQYLAPATNQGGLIFGQEYLSAFHKKIMAFNFGGSTQLKIRFSGDSTTAGDATTSGFHIDQLIQGMAQQHGLPQIKGENGGVSGKDTEHWNQTYYSNDLASDPDLLVLRWGINDPYYSHASNAMLPDQSVVNPSIDAQRRTKADFEASLRSGLTKIRAAKSLNQLSIVLMVPNSVSDTPNGRDQEWIESLVPVIREAARDFQCCFANTYQYLQDSANADDFMDNPYGDGRHIHPKDCANLWIASLIYDAIFPSGLVDKCRQNNLVNDYNQNVIKDSTELPNTYPIGISVFRAQGTFPYNGQVVTIRGVDGVLTQFNNHYVPASGNGLAYRMGGTSSNTWGEWIRLTANEALVRPALQNSWVDYYVAGGSQAEYYKDGVGLVHLQGLIKSGTTTANTLLFTLPTGYRPAIDRFFAVATNTGLGVITIGADGTVRIQSGGNGYLSLDSINFRPV